MRFRLLAVENLTAKEDYCLWGMQPFERVVGTAETQEMLLSVCDLPRRVGHP